MKTNIGMTKDCFDSLLRVNDRICRYFSYINDSETSFVIGKEADMNNQPNYFCLRSVDFTETKHECAKFLQQRSDEWFELRKQSNHQVQCIQHLGLHTQNKTHYDSVILNKDRNGVQSPTTQMLHDIENEKHGIREDKAFLVASPDDEGDEGQMKRILFEIKCPYKSDWKTNVSYSIPNNYVLQLITQMGASKECYGYHITESILFRGLKNRLLFLVKFGEDLWNAIVAFCMEHSRRPTKKRPKTKELSTYRYISETNVKYLGEFKSESHSMKTSILLRLIEVWFTLTNIDHRKTYISR
ncbi:unnamed protein product [Mytilus coruscus]|uniref:YqaJ viral recombinase domain-containing protein n=1 Tax=Mytilus coruscus TaxID=42192 RepID=A0A6J8CRX7_MYTCO|nr:unnamed protein product [Mytilus coruscus]